MEEFAVVPPPDVVEDRLKDLTCWLGQIEGDLCEILDSIDGCASQDQLADEVNSLRSEIADAETRIDDIIADLDEQE